MTKKQIAQVNHAAYEAFKAQWTEDEWCDMFRGGHTAVHVVLLEDEAPCTKTERVVVSYLSQVNKEMLKNHGFGENARATLLFTASKSTKTLSYPTDRII